MALFVSVHLTRQWASMATAIFVQMKPALEMTAIVSTAIFVRLKSVRVLPARYWAVCIVLNKWVILVWFAKMMMLLSMKKGCVNALILNKWSALKDIANLVLWLDVENVLKRIHMFAKCALIIRVNWSLETVFVVVRQHFLLTRCNASVVILKTALQNALNWLDAKNAWLMASMLLFSVYHALILMIQCWYQDNADVYLWVIFGSNLMMLETAKHAMFQDVPLVLKVSPIIVPNVLMMTIWPWVRANAFAVHLLSRGRGYVLSVSLDARNAYPQVFAWNVLILMLISKVEYVFVVILNPL